MTNEVFTKDQIIAVSKHLNKANAKSSNASIYLM